MKKLKFKQWIIPMIVGLFVLLSSSAKAQVVELDFSNLNTETARLTGAVPDAGSAPYYSAFVKRTVAEGEIIPTGDTLYSSNNGVRPGTTGLAAVGSRPTVNGVEVTNTCNFAQPRDMYLKLNSTTAKRIVLYGKLNGNAERSMLPVRFAVKGGGSGVTYTSNGLSNQAAYTGSQGFTLTKWDGSYVAPGTGFNVIKDYQVDGNAIRDNIVTKSFSNGVKFTLVNGPKLSASSNFPGNNGFVWNGTADIYPVVIDGFTANAGDVVVLGHNNNANGYHMHKIVIVPVGTNVDVTSLAIKNASTEELIMGTAPTQLIVRAEPIYGDYKWSIEEGGAFATIDENTGVITPVAEGTVKVRVSGVDAASAVYDEITLQVITTTSAASVEITGIPSDYDGTAAKGLVGSSYDLGATVLPLNTTYKSVSFSIADAGTTAATIAKDGKSLKATSAGTVVVHVLVDSTSAVVADSTIEFAVRSVASISITNAPGGNMEIGDDVTLGATVLPADASDKSVTWSVETGDAVSVSTAGKVTALRAGTATVRATANDGSGIYGEVSITVNQGSIYVSGIVVSGGVSSINEGETASVPFTATIQPGDATVQNYTLDIIQAGNGRASINAAGLITGVEAGSVMVCATVTDPRGTYKAYAPVVVSPVENAIIGSGNARAEVLVIYENFGGLSASEKDIAPVKWPAVHADSGKPGGYYMVAGTHKVTNTVNTLPMPTPGWTKDGSANNECNFDIDSIRIYKSGDLGVTQEGKNWIRQVQLYNGYTVGGSNTVPVRFRDVPVFPEFYSFMSYDTVASPMWISENRNDEVGYVFFGKKSPNNDEYPVMRIPHTGALSDISRMEVLISGTRTNRMQSFIVRVQRLDEDGYEVAVDTLTYSVASTPRYVNIPINGNRVRLYLEARGDGNNANIVDINTGLTGNTGIIEPYTFNRNVYNATGNPNIMLHMLKVYANMEDVAGYSVTAPSGVTVSKGSGITYGEEVTIQATNTTNFVGWKISGREDLSEVANPVTIKVTENMSVTPVYVGDMVEVAVVNETFVDWPSYYEAATDATQAGYGLIRVSGSAMYSAYTGDRKVPFRYGFQNGGDDSVAITLNNCNIVPDRTIRVHNAPGAHQWLGYVHFFGPAANNKGYVDVDSIEGITKVQVELSSYDNPTQFNRAAAVLVNGDIKRNKMLQTLYAEKVEVPVSATATNLRVGYGNQLYAEHFRDVSGAPSYDGNYIKNTIGVASIAMHSLKMYAKISAPSGSFYQLNTGDFVGGNVNLAPAADNSTQHYFAGTTVTLRATPEKGFGFDGWVDENNQPLGMADVITVTMDAGKTVKPVFAKNPSYITIVNDDTKGTLTFSEEPQNVNGSTYEFLAGVPISVTATPIYEYKTSKFVKDGSDVVNSAVNPVFKISFTASEMIKDATINLSSVYDYITDEVGFRVLQDTIKGSVKFDNEPRSFVYDGDTIVYSFPLGSGIKLSTTAGYSWSVDTVVDINTGKSLNTAEAISMNDDNGRVRLAYNRLSYKLLVIENDDDLLGYVEVTDEHRFGDKESQGLWPINYSVELTSYPSEGYTLGSLGDVAYMMGDEDKVYVTMDRDTVNVLSEYIEQQEGVFLTFNENFQLASRWPENLGTVSNVPGARSFLSLPDWNPINEYSQNVESFLRTLSKYRVHGSESNSNSDGPNSTKTPPSTLNMVWKQEPYEVKVAVLGSTKDSIKIQLANFAPCNDCLIGKAVKETDVSNRYLGHVSPGMVALKKPNVADNTRRATEAAFQEGDTLGMMYISGLAYVEKLEVGYVSSGSQFCPGVFYSTDGSFDMTEEGTFAGDYSGMNVVGEVSRVDYSPYNGRYGWGSSTEGMIMDQNMYVADPEALETQIIITPGIKKAGAENDKKYVYSTIYIHDLKIWGSPSQMDPTSTPSQKTGDDGSFYMLGNTNILKVDKPNVKAVVIYNEMGTAVKVVRGLDIETIDMSGYKAGVYFVHAYNTQGQRSGHKFIKINN